MPLSAENRARNTYIEASLDNTLELLSDKTVAQWLGPKALANTQKIIKDCLFPAFFRDGIVQPPKKLDNDRIPVIALHPGDLCLVHQKIGLQTPLQTHRAHEAARQQIGSAKQVQEQIGKYSAGAPIGDARPMRVKFEADPRGSIQWLIHHVVGGNHQLTNYSVPHLRSRPIVVLPYNPVAPRINPDTVVHQALHGLEVLKTPLVYGEEPGAVRNLLLQEELTASHYQARFIGALSSIGYEPLPEEDPSVPVAVYIDNLRNRTNITGSDPLSLNASLRAELERVGLDASYNPAA